MLMRLGIPMERLEVNAIIRGIGSDPDNSEIESTIAWNINVKIGDITLKAPFIEIPYLDDPVLVGMNIIDLGK